MVVPKDKIANKSVTLLRSRVDFLSMFVTPRTIASWLIILLNSDGMQILQVISAQDGRLLSW